MAFQSYFEICKAVFNVYIFSSVRHVGTIAEILDTMGFM